MNVNPIFVALISIFLLANCGEEQTPNSELDEYQEMAELLEEMELDPVVNENGGDGHEGHDHEGHDHNTEQGDFEIMVPEKMFPTTALNPEADAQYAYLEELPNENGDSIVYEHYLVVLMEKKAEIQGYPDELKLDVLKYRDDVIEIMKGSEGISNFKLNKNEVGEGTLNGMSNVVESFTATIQGVNGPIDLFYKLGIFEGKKAFYQVMTWCVNEQREMFESDMNQIIQSLTEK